MQKKWNDESVNTDLTRISAKLEVIYGQKWLALLVAEVKGMKEQGLANARIAEMHKELVEIQAQHWVCKLRGR